MTTAAVLAVITFVWLGSVSAAAAQGTIYKWTDAQGKVHFSNAPVGTAEAVDEVLPPAASFASPSQGSPSPPASEPASAPAEPAAEPTGEERETPVAEPTPEEQRSAQTGDESTSDNQVPADTEQTAPEELGPSSTPEAAAEALESVETDTAEVEEPSINETVDTEKTDSEETAEDEEE
jgi:hypothetical protein